MDGGELPINLSNVGALIPISAACFPESILLRIVLKKIRIRAKNSKMLTVVPTEAGK